MKYLKFLLLLIFFNVLCYSQTNNSQFFPLNTGNKFFYKKIHCGPGNSCDTSYRVSRILHSRIFNGKTYYYCQSFLGWGILNDSIGNGYNNVYLRYDSASGCLVKLDSLNSFCNFEKKIYKLSSAVGDSTGTSCIFENTYQCTRIFDTTYFNTTVNSKKYRYSVSNSSSQTIKEAIFGRNIGAYYISSIVNTSQSTQRYYNYLIGAVINGTVYGDTSAVLGITQISSNIPNDFSLLQNYPNPFNPATNIKFQIPKAGFVKLVVYDVLGKVVQTLVNQELSPGSYSIDFDGSNLPSGVYYYRIETNTFTETKKMVLIK